MQNNQLNRLLKLINRTGDRLVVLDKDTDTSVVMMEIDEYEKILNGGPRLEDMSESDILDKINREVAVWREKNMANSADAVLEEEPVVCKPTVEEEIPEIDEVEDEEIDEELAEISHKEVEKIPEEPITINPIIGPEVELKDLPDDGEEEKFYLEPV